MGSSASEIKNKKTELKKQLQDLQNEEQRLRGRYGECIVCVEEKQLIDGLHRTCFDCDEKRRQKETDQIYSKFIGKKIVKINAEPRHVYSIDPDIFSIEIEGGYTIKVASWSDPRAMEIEKP